MIIRERWQSLLTIFWWSLWLIACGPASNTPTPATAPPAVSIPATVQAPNSTAADTATPPISATLHPPTGTPQAGVSASGTPAVCPPPSAHDVPLGPAAEGGTSVEMFEPPILAYLNAGGDPQTLQALLEPLALDDGKQTWQATSQVYHTDVTGDATPEVVVSLLFYVEGQFADGGLFVFRCQTREYVGGTVIRIGAQLFAGQGPEPVVHSIQDMNNNGLADLVISYVTVIGTHANFTREFRILEWDGSRFVDLIQSEGDRPYAAKVLNGEGVVCDIDGDGVLELRLVHGPERGPGADGASCAPIDLWSWNGEAFVLSDTEPCPSLTLLPAMIV